MCSLSFLQGVCLSVCLTASAVQGFPGPAAAALSMLAPAGPLEREDQALAQIDFAALGTEFLEARGLKPEGLTFSGLLAGEAFLRVPLGGIDLHVPLSALADADVVAEVKKQAGMMIDLQETWFAWRGPATTSIAKDWKTLHDWVGGWPTRKLGHLAGGPQTLYDQLQASEKVRAAQANLRESTRQPEEMTAAIGEGHLIVLAPTRRDFVQLAAVAGLLEPAIRAGLWAQQTISQGSLWVHWTQLVALEYPPAQIDPDDPLRGLPMTACDQTELLQFVADRAAAILLRKEFCRHESHFLEGGLGTNLVIAVVGKNDLNAGEWSYHYRTSGSKTEAYEVFVPGGNSGGGVLQARKAGPGTTTIGGTSVARYRDGGGEDYFLDPLRDAQRLGAKLVPKHHPLSKDKIAHFVLSLPEGGGSISVSAPFLGEASLNKPPPPKEYLDDYGDLSRAYTCLFVHWLKEHGDGSAEDSAARFGELIAKDAVRTSETPSQAVFAEVYGVPLSAEDGSVESLEWRFLSWLSKSK